MNTQMFIFITVIILASVFVVLFAKPIRMIAKIVLNSAIGGIFIAVFNFISQLFGIFIGVNVLTALTVGILGIPGFLMLLMFRIVMN